jgi:ABC-type multidrug transport system fused ATPase/permease subunit
MARGRGAEAERAKSRAIRPLRRLVPFLAPYRLLLAAALVALVVTAMLALALPLAVRRVVDGFFIEDLRMMDPLLRGGHRDRGAPGGRDGAPLLPRDAAGRAGDRGHPARDLRQGDRAVAGLLRAADDRRGAVAADDGHDASPLGRGLEHLHCAPQRADLLRRAGAALRHQPQAHGARPRRRAGGRGADPHPRPAAQGAQSREPGPDRRVERAGLRDAAGRAGGAGLHARGDEPGDLRQPHRAGLRRGAAAHLDPLADDGDCDLPRLHLGGRRALDRGARRAGRGHVSGRARSVRDLRRDGGRLGGGAVGDLGRVAAGGRRDRAHGRANRRRGRHPRSRAAGAGAGAGAG